MRWPRWGPSHTDTDVTEASNSLCELDRYGMIRQEATEDVEVGEARGAIFGGRLLHVASRCLRLPISQTWQVFEGRGLAGNVNALDDLLLAFLHHATSFWSLVLLEVKCDRYACDDSWLRRV